MRWWKFSTILTLAAALGALGCGGSSSSGVSITISPTTASVITNSTQLFSGAGNRLQQYGDHLDRDLRHRSDREHLRQHRRDWTLHRSCHDPDDHVQRHDDDCAGGHDHGHRASRYDQNRHGYPDHPHRNQHHHYANLALPWARASLFLFTATVNNPGCNLTSNPTCENVTWSLSTTLTGIGTIGSTTGVYTAPATVPSPSTVIITATSVADTSVTATATVTVETATTPTVTSVSPNTTALGGLFQDIYITGTNFISTDNVYINGVRSWPPPSSPMFPRSVIRARIPDFLLAVPPPSSILADRRLRAVRGGSDVHADASLCEITVAGVRPGVVGPSPDSIPQGTAGVLVFQRGWGILWNGIPLRRLSPQPTTANSGRYSSRPAKPSTARGQLHVTIGGGSNSSDFTVPGLYPVDIKSTTDTTKFAVANLAVQPDLHDSPCGCDSNPGRLDRRSRRPAM